MVPERRPSILVVEDDAGTALLQRRRLERSGFDVDAVDTVDTALRKLAYGRFDLVLVDYRLGASNGLDLHRQMKAVGSDVPVIMVSGAMDNATVIEAIRAGVRDVVIKDVDYLDHLPDAVRAVLNQAAVNFELQSQPLSGGCVLILEDDPGVASLQRKHLERAGYTVKVATRAEQALQIARSSTVHLALLDLRLDEHTTGLDVYEEMKASGLAIPAILVSAHADQDIAIRALRAGLRDFVPKTNDYLQHLPRTVERVIAQVRIERKLLEAELKFASIIGSSMDAIVMCDEHGRIVLFNRAAEAMFACAADDVLGTKFARFAPNLDLSPHTQQQDGNELNKRTEVDALRASGEPIPIEVSMSEVLINRRRFVTVIARDISERRRIEAELRDADRRKDEFLGMLAHELRNPVAAIMNAGEVLNRTLRDESAQKLVGVVKRQTNALAHMVDDLLDVSRVTLGKIQLAREPILLNQLVWRAIESIRENAVRQNLKISVVTDSEPLWLFADATRLEQVLVNLLNNAVKFTPSGGQITVQAQLANDQAVVRVQDTGVGIDRQLLPKIFDLFVQGDMSLDRSKSGLGIGLALVKQLVALHGGTVEAHSEGPRSGSEFVVRLPLSSHVKTGPANSSEDEPKIPGNLRIMVVDDQPDIANSVASLLQISGYDVRTCYDGPSALNASLTDRPDVMIVDVGMPGMTGYELAQRVRQDPQLNAIKLIALTGYGREQDRARAITAGFNVHLTKPVTFEHLERALADLQE
jgi:PAS domain S-box-containing protein